MAGAKVEDRLYRYLLPVFVIYKMTGMLPTRIAARLITRRSDIAYTLLFVAGYALLGAYSVLTFPERAASAAEPRRLVILWASTLFGCQMAMLVFAFRYRSALIAGLNQLARMDGGALALLHITADHSTAASVRVVLVITASVVARTFVTLGVFGLNSTQVCATFMMALAKTLCKCQFAMLITPVMLRFRKINAALGELMRPLSAGGAGGGERAEAARRVRLQRLTRAHFKLCNVCRTIHDALSFTLLLAMIQTAVNIFFQTFSLYLTLTQACKDCGFIHYFSPMLWLLDETVESIYLIRICEITTAEANQIGSLLHKLRRFVRESCANDIYSYSIECLHLTLKFDMAGFVVLDYNLLYMFVQVFSTYFIICIQFYETHLSDKPSNATLSGGSNASYNC